MKLYVYKLPIHSVDTKDMDMIFVSRDLQQINTASACRWASTPGHEALDWAN